MINLHKLEFWADSFHEGDWASKGLATFLDVKSVEFIEGFIPKYTFLIDESNELEVTVFGSYKNWSPLPAKISELLDWGKPDLIIYDPISEKIILAVEETAAVPTGNQALQRCERIYGSSRSEIPFWYLLSEFGLHVDGGVRRDSIWPTVLALKLSCIKRTPSVVLHYSDIKSPEDYSAGEGYTELFKVMHAYVLVWAGLAEESILTPILKGQYQHMLDFVNTQWHSITSFIAGLDEVNENTAGQIADYVAKDSESELNFLEYLNWGKTDAIPRPVYQKISPSGIIKQDRLINELESLVRLKHAYNLASGAGSKPQPKNSVETWIAQQKRMFETGNKTNASFEMKIDDFPLSPTGNIHVTTAKNVYYLADSWGEVKDSINSAYPRLAKKWDDENNNEPVLVFISNSLKPGRIFGDPFTGQLSAYSNIFSKNLIGQKTRLVVAYYPHQSHTQLFTPVGAMRTNKGIVIMKELLDIAIFQGGVAVDFKTMRIL
jgi:hypothetical protein